MRYYDPDLAMWISTDPVKQFYDAYAYASNGYNPINAIDPLGFEIDVTKGKDNIVNVHITATLIDHQTGKIPFDIGLLSAGIVAELNKIEGAKFTLDLNLGSPRKGDHLIHISNSFAYFDFSHSKGVVRSYMPRAMGLASHLGMDMVLQSGLSDYVSLIAHEFTHNMGYLGKGTGVKVITATQIYENRNLMNQMTPINKRYQHHTDNPTSTTEQGW